MSYRDRIYALYVTFLVREEVEGCSFPAIVEVITLEYCPAHIKLSIDEY